MTSIALLTLIICHPKFKNDELLHLHAMQWGQHWSLIPKIMCFALNKLVSSIHEAAIPLVLALIAAHDSRKTAANFNVGLQHYNFMRIVSLAFLAALYRFIPQLKGEYLKQMASNSQSQLLAVILKNIQHFIAFGLLTVFGVGVIAAASIYFLLRTFTPGISDDANYLLGFYAGVGLLNALNTNMGGILAMMNNQLNTVNMLVSSIVSWGALSVFITLYYNNIIGYKQAGPVFFAAELLKALILSVPLYRFVKRDNLKLPYTG